MANWKPSDKTAVTTPALTDIHAIEQGGVIYKETNAQILGLVIDVAQPQWTLDTNTWSYSSADAPSYVFTVNADVTSSWYVGQKIKYTQDATVKYGIITAIGAYTSSTPVTIYGGGNTASPSYAMSANAITNPYYAATWRPFDFPINPDTWSYIVTDTTNRNQLSPVSGTWYNLGSVSISIPIGLWLVEYSVFLYGANTTGSEYLATLSTGNNSETDNDFTSGILNNSIYLGGTCYKNKILTLASKTSYYLNSKQVSGDCVSLFNRNATSKLILRATCKYL